MTFDENLKFVLHILGKNTDDPSRHGFDLFQLLFFHRRFPLESQGAGETSLIPYPSILKTNLKIYFERR